MNTQIQQIKLTSRQEEVLRLMALGKTNSEIAQELYITIHTVKAHICSIYALLKTSSRVQTVVVALQYGLINLEELNTQQINN